VTDRQQPKVIASRPQDSTRAADLYEAGLIEVKDRPGTAIPKILHIEDDPSVARSMARLLRLNGYEVINAATREEAIHHVNCDGLRPDLILTDFQLATRVTGEEIVAEISARLQCKIPTIMLTGTKHQTAERSSSVVDRLLAKPTDINVLLREIESLIGRSP
jgi:DNA-binding response OmpR family regulator